MRDLPAGNQVPSSGGTAAEVASRLIDADDPMAFVKQNLSRRVTPEQIVTGEAPGSSIVEAPHSVEPSFVSPSGDIQFDSLKPSQRDDTVSPQPREEQPPSPEQQASEGNPLLEEVKTKKTKDDSAREARQKINELNITLGERETQLSTIEERLAAYERGELIAEPVKAKLDRTEQLEQYEVLHNLRMSPKYQQQYVEPIEALKQKAIKLAADYKVDPNVLDDALEIEGRKEQNAFLKRHFDDIGALEVRNTLEEIARISDEAVEAEKQPSMTFERLKLEHQNDMQRHEATRYEGLNRSAQQGWNEALQEIKQEGTYPELILTGDSRQDAIAKPILKAAAEEYGKFIKLLGFKKMEDLPPEASKILSKRFLLSQAAGVAMASRAHHYQRAEEVIENTRRDAPYMRPQVGSSNVSPSVPTATKKQSLEDVADGLINSVLQKKRN